ncbi:hypothetical protein [Nocardia wallacei]|uniref:hypothetical protein n=1 Tax=Nocardia wallacei TaxID=480035 RepID=UPI00165704CF|nr:hypothetical protein [Nocardia wallacei]
MAGESPVVRWLANGSIAVYFTLVDANGDFEAGRWTFEPEDDDFEFWATMASPYTQEGL